MKKDGNAIARTDPISACFRPNRSPIQPNSAPPTGRMRKPAAKVPKAASSEDGRVAAPGRSARRSAGRRTRTARSRTTRACCRRRPATMPRRTVSGSVELLGVNVLRDDLRNDRGGRHRQRLWFGGKAGCFLRLRYRGERRAGRPGTKTAARRAAVRVRPVTTRSFTLCADHLEAADVEPPAAAAPASFFMPVCSRMVVSCCMLVVSLRMLVSFNAAVSIPLDVPVTVTLWPTCWSSLTVLLVNEYAFPSVPVMVKASLAVPLDRQPVTLVGCWAVAGDVSVPARRATAAASSALLVPNIVSLLRAPLGNPPIRPRRVRLGPANGPVPRQSL